MPELVTKLEADDTWLCHHVDAAGNPAAPTSLRLTDTHEWPHRVSNSRRWVNCADCGTRWLVWTQLRKAKPSVCFPRPDPEGDSDRSRHAPVRDVDRVIQLVCRAKPLISVQQFENAWPGDDDGLWFFSEPGAAFARVQIESSSGHCPFLVEGAQCRIGNDIDEVVRYLLEELEAPERAS